jgi:hypothetical protein
MKFLRKVFGLDFPDPEAGQVWRSGFSGRLMKVDDVHVTDCGTPIIYVAHEHADALDGWLIAMHYCVGLDEWRRRLREERRVLQPAWPRK